MITTPTYYGEQFKEYGGRKLHLLEERDFFINGTREKIRCSNGRNLRIFGEYHIKPNGKLGFHRFTKRQDYSKCLLIIDPDQIVISKRD